MNIIQIYDWRCELLSDFISLSFGHNYLALRTAKTFVVNCFQILYLCPSDTTVIINSSPMLLL